MIILIILNAFVGLVIIKFMADGIDILIKNWVDIIVGMLLEI
jgi:hypothetical protein